jgi:hypothetical protein
MPLTAGDRIGRYEILTPLGVGGMDEVYKARDTRLGRDATIQVLPPALAHDPQRMARFERAFWLRSTTPISAPSADSRKAAARAR